MLAEWLAVEVGAAGVLVTTWLGKRAAVAGEKAAAAGERSANAAEEATAIAQLAAETDARERRRRGLEDLLRAVEAVRDEITGNANMDWIARRMRTLKNTPTLGIQKADELQHCEWTSEAGRRLIRTLSD